MTQPPNVVSMRVPVPVASTQGTLALDLQPHLEPPGAEVLPLEHRARVDVEQWARRFVQAAIEIVGGDRPVSQLLRWTTPEVYDELGRRAEVVARAGDHQPGQGRVQPVRPRVRSVHTCPLSADVVEVSAHARYGRRSRALAVRFERRRGRWLCTALVWG